MESKLGTHENTIMNRDKLRDFILTARPKVIKTLHHDAGFWGEIKAEYPELLLIGRKYFDKQRYDNPIGDAEKAVRKILDTSTAHICDAWEVYNEALGGHGWDEPTKDYLQFDAHAGVLLHREGLKHVGGSWSVGCPSDLGVWTWRHMLAVVNAADYIGVHEYLAWLMWHLKGFDPQYEDREQYLTSGWFTLRYRMVRGILEELLARGEIDRIPDFIVTECGIDGGAWHWGDPSHQGGWRQANVTPAEYMEQLAWYDDQLQMDDYVVGATIYCGQVADLENWASFRLGDEMMPLLQAHIIASREDVPDVEPEPVPDDAELNTALLAVWDELEKVRPEMIAARKGLDEAQDKVEAIMEGLPDPTPLIPFWAAITASALAHGVDPYLIAGICKVESNWDPAAVGDGGYSRGLGQFAAPTWNEVMGDDGHGWDAAFVPELAVEGVARFIDSYSGWLATSWNTHDIKWTLACYNWGSGRCRKVLASGGTWADVPEVVRKYATRVISWRDQYEEQNQ